MADSRNKEEPQVQSLAVLVVGNQADADRIALLLSSARAPRAPPISISHVDTVTAACARLERVDMDAVILGASSHRDWRLKLSAIQSVGPALPVIVIVSNEEEGRETIGAGAQDYVLEPLVDGAVLRRALRYGLERQRLVRKLDAAVHTSEAAVRRAVAGRDRAVGIVSHDLRNLLSTIQVCANALLDSEAPPREGVRDMSSIIQRCADLMQQIVQDLLDKSSLDAGQLALKLEATNVDELVRAAQAMFAPLADEHSVEFVVESAAAMPPLNADPQRLLQVLANLLSNAMKFTPAGGRVVLTARSAGTNETVSGVESAVYFAVRDNGPGIPPEDLQHIFDWFWQSRRGKRRGTGLGLAIAKDLIEAHRGVLRADSVPGEGSRFWFTIPAMAGPAAARSSLPLSLRRTRRELASGTSPHVTTP